MKKIFIFGIIMILLMSVVVACDNEDLTNTDKPKLVTTTFPTYDFASRIAGDLFDVEILGGEGHGVHGWEPSTKDISKLNQADVFVYNGAGLEPWVDKVLNSLENEDLVVVNASEGIDLIQGHHHEAHSEEGHDHEGHGEEGHDHEHGDPHIWTSPINAKIMAENIANGLIRYNQEQKTSYEQNLTELNEELDQLDREYKEGLKDLKCRDIIVSHEAFGYMCKDYNLNQIGIESINSESEPDPKTMAKITDFIQAKNIPAIFVETLEDTKVAETIANEAGVEVKTLNPLEGRTKEEMESGEDYFSLMRQNLKTLTEELK